VSASLTVTAASRSRYPSTAATNSSARRPCRSELPLRLSSGDTSSGDTILNPNCSRRLGFQPDNAVRRRIVAVPPRRDRPPQRVPLVAVVAVVSCRSPSLAAVTRCSPLATLGPVALAKGARHSQLPSHGSPLARVSAGAGAGAGDGEAIVQQAPSFAAGRTEGGASAPPVVAGGGSERSHGSRRPGEGRG